MAAEKKEIIPTRDDVRAAALWTARNTNRIPTLWGPTASGKTWMVHEIAEEMGAEYIVVLLGQHTPDEIAGFQVIGKQNQLIAQKPFWFRNAQSALDEGRPVVLLFDELNTAREEVRGALYTFFRDRHLHGDSLGGSEETLIFAAMNPAMLAPAYRSRCSFFHVPAENSYMVQMATNEWAKTAANVGAVTSDSDPTFSNEPPPAPETIDASAVAALNGIDASFWELSEAAQQLILYSVAPPAVVETLLDSHQALDGTYLVKYPDRIRGAIEELDVPRAVALATSVLDAVDSVDKKQAAKAVVAVLEGVYTSADKLEAYFSAEKPETVINKLLALDPETLIKELKERGAFYEIEKDGQPDIAGSFRDQLEKFYAEQQNSAGAA